MLIRELSRKTSASVRSIRYYETKKLLIPKRLENGYREYDETAVERVKTIQLYISLGLNTDDIAQIIDCPTSMQSGRPLCKLVRKLYKAKLADVNSKIAILHQVQLRLQERIQDFEES
ncbi:DNA-binding transcriptional MerR regulator [Sporomusaceae bacterium BoRhaA]|uniref:MerR family transcriptional regulator n=1 Tax=Pelorhabdus rhamnosifermentans TaxID=2772457 RepID=UPI001C062F1B|nr:MerR family transcriptional regulator [Pelorhabdus rhamnosifermentans]MBU2700529.1 DNA-binding transcriptional MerR regulator [Pelorhabdus rhamnosifermentans]